MYMYFFVATSDIDTPTSHTSPFVLVSQARLSLRSRESGQIPIRLLYCIVSSSISNEVGVNINWDVFWKGRSSISLNSMPKKATACLRLSLTQLTHQEILGVLEMRQ